MARLIACPRCQIRIDVSDVSPGASVRCPDCGQMSRVPTGNTSLRVKPAVVVQAPAAAPLPERPTKMRQRSGGRAAPPPPKASNTPLILGIAVGAIGIIVAIVALKGNSSSVPAAPEPVVRKTVAAQPVPPPAAPTPAPAIDKPKDPPPAGPGRPRDPSKTNWDQILSDLRPGGGFDHLDRPEGAAFAEVKAMGKAAYPHLIRYIDVEDVMIGRAAVTVLGELTGKKGPLPNDNTKAKIKAEWDAWLKENP